MVGVIAIGTIASLNPVESDGFMKGDKSPQHDFGGEVSRRPHVRFYAKLKHLAEYEKMYFVGKIRGHFSPSLSLLRY
jgi:hypothetical protein